ncbi:ROK family transcriptional regulator [Nonomuraea thailandensis]
MTELRPGDASLLRKVNTQVTLAALRRAGVATLTQLGRVTGLSRQTVEAVLDELGERGYVREVPPDEGVMGRPARRFGFRADAGYVVGVEVGGEAIVAALADLNGEVIAWERAEVSGDAAAHERLEAAERAALRCVDGAGVARRRIWTVAAGTSGIVDRTGRVSLSITLPGWTGVDLAGLAGRWFGCTALAANDANLAALAEHWRGSAQHAADVVYVLIGHRAGAGILIGGRLHPGRSGAAGEIGTLRQVGWEDAARELVKDASAAEVFEAALGVSATRCAGWTATPRTWPSAPRRSSWPSTPTCWSSAGVRARRRRAARTAAPAPGRAVRERAGGGDLHVRRRGGGDRRGTPGARPRRTRDPGALKAPAILRAPGHQKAPVILRAPGHQKAPVILRAPGH